jgi:hypothetical protein
LIGNASGRVVATDSGCPCWCPEAFSIRRLEGRRVAVAGAAMELEGRIGLRELVRKPDAPVWIRHDERNNSLDGAIP